MRVSVFHLVIIFSYVIPFPRVSTADAQTQNDNDALMENLVFIYWGDNPCVAEPPITPPTEILGASATHDKD
jgi:hypothetical protein